jgi:hypothetical protein
MNCARHTMATETAVGPAGELDRFAASSRTRRTHSDMEAPERSAVVYGRVHLTRQAHAQQRGLPRHRQRRAAPASNPSDGVLDVGVIDQASLAGVRLLGFPHVGAELVLRGFVAHPHAASGRSA